MKKANRRKFTPKAWAVLVSVALLVTVAVGSTVAFLVADGGSATNVFEPTTVTSAVHENGGNPFDGVTKTDVKVQNTGDVPAYIRAAVVITWQDENGNVLAETPADTDYSIQWQYGGDRSWFDGGDGYFYYKNAVPSGSKTAESLIRSISNAKTKTVGETAYYVCVEIVSSAIQADPFRDGTADISDVWPAVEVSDRHLVKAS